VTDATIAKEARPFNRSSMVRGPLKSSPPPPPAALDPRSPQHAHVSPARLSA
jgi:hypothetical protein